MPPSLSPKKRANDNDRADTARRLDEAYADGQLSPGEHEERLTTALHATTLGQLAALTVDLQSGTVLPSMTKPRARKQHNIVRFLVPAIVTLLVMGLLIWAAGGRNESDDEVNTAGEQYSYLTPRGLAEVIAAIRAKFGNATVDDLTVYPGYAVVFRAAEDAPLQQLSYYYNGEFREPTDSGTRKDLPMVDLKTVDIMKVASVIAGAGTSLNLSRVDQSYLVIRAGEEEPEVLVFASNDKKESGHLALDIHGSFLAVYPSGQ
ncbi:DUF1707 domain-containing protein [Antrihabitans stalactiti]|uniref:DUF1707 domain-containing protein n=1 Tax=Antrihabitans stalactiti TaxID=2584121 RepID=UPI00146C53CE